MALIETQDLWKTYTMGDEEIHALRGVSIKIEKGEYVANEAYKDVPGAVFREGNLPRADDTAVHAVDDVVLQSTGPGSEEFKGYLEESDVYRVVVDALALAPQTN